MEREKPEPVRDNLKGLGGKNPFNARLPGSLRSALETSAKLANRSLNAHITLLLEISLANSPVVSFAPAITEPLSKATFGIRLQDSTKKQLEDAARACGRAINTEIVIRLLLAGGLARESAVPANYIGIEADLRIAWERLSQAIDATLRASVFDLSKAADELRAAKAEYEVLIIQKRLAENSTTTALRKP